MATVRDVTGRDRWWTLIFHRDERGFEWDAASA
jgi:hypothetical protein